MDNSLKSSYDIKFSPVSAVVAIVALRIMSSWNWINGAFFGTDAKVTWHWLSGDGFVERAQGAGGFAEKALYPWMGDFIGDFMVHEPEFWAWFIFLAYAVAGISLFFGFFTRVGGLVAICAALMNLLGAGGNGADTIGKNGLLLILGAIFLLSGAGRVYGVDGYILKKCKAKWLRFLM